MVADLKEAYDACQRITKAEAKNFYYAFRTLPSEKRRAIYAAYAYCRVCDDIADDPMPDSERETRFAALRADLDSALNGGGAGDPILMALADASARFGFTRELLIEVIEGVEMDLVKSRFANFDELREYCYKVASAVGLISIEIFGYDDPAATEYAVDLGLAMQLTNIMRDVKEDAERDRIYIPLDEMARFGYTEADLKAGVVNQQFRSLMAFQAQRARAYFDSGARLIPLLSAESRACTGVLHALYSTILDRIEKSGFDVFRRRVGLSSSEKLLLMARLWAFSLLPRLPIPGRPSGR
jgi:15-cis-phytoene synthase